MRNFRRNSAALFIAVLMLLSFCFGAERVQADESRDYLSKIGNGIILSYDYGKTNGVRDYGFIIVPDVEGTLPAMVLFHGGTGLKLPENSTNGGAVGRNWINTVIRKGHLQPRIVIMPMVPNTSTDDKNHQNYDYPAFMDKVFPSVLNRIEDGTFNGIIEKGLKDNNISKKTSIDTTIRKHTVSGYSMGGGAALYVGAKYKDRIAYVGSLSPAERFCMWRSSDKRWIGWAFDGGFLEKEEGFSFTDPDPKFYIPYSDARDRFLFMGMSDGEASEFSGKTIENGGYTPAGKFWDRFAKKSGFVYCRFYAGGHNSATFLREFYCFLYQLEYGKAPNKEMLEQVCGTPDDLNMLEREYLPDSVEIEETKPDEREEIKGTLTKKGVNGNPKPGDRMAVEISNSNCNTFAYSWYITNGKTQTLKCTNAKCDVDKSWVGYNIICKVSDSSGKYKGYLSADFGKVTEQTQPAEPTVTTKPADPTVTTKPAKPTVTTKPADPTVTTKPAKPTVTTKPADPTVTTKPAEPTVTTKPGDTLTPTMTPATVTTVPPTITPLPDTVIPDETVAPTATEKPAVTPTVTFIPSATPSVTGSTATPSAAATPSVTVSPAPGKAVTTVTPVITVKDEVSVKPVPVDDQILRSGGNSYKPDGNGNVVFDYVSSLVTDVNIPSEVRIGGKRYKVTAIAPGAFKGNKNIRSVVIGKNIKSIGAEAFRNCKKLKKVLFKTVKLKKSRVGKNAFKGIAKKATFTLPKKKFKSYKKFLPKAAKGTKIRFKKK